MKKINNNEIIRYNPDINYGLNNEQVENRNAQKLYNHYKQAYGKSYAEIIFSNLFSVFNIVLFIIAGLLIFCGAWKSLFFLFVLIPNIAIGLYEDIKARRLVSKLRLVTAPQATLLRNGKIEKYNTKDVVLDDLIILEAGNQICADSIILKGEVLVNESFLTGESKSVIKKVGDKLFSGSFVVSGNAITKVDAVGKASLAQSIENKANKFKRSPSQILKSLRNIFKVIALFVFFVSIATVILYAIQGKFTIETYKASIVSICGSVIAMIPCGLYLLTSVALAISVIALSKKNALIQDFYSVEMLARCDVVCFDKTGTLTDGNIDFESLEIINEKYSQQDIGQIIANIILSTKDNNSTAKALKNHFLYELTKNPSKIIPFNSNNKFSAVAYSNQESYVLGAPECLNYADKNTILNKCSVNYKVGNRVLILGKLTSSNIDTLPNVEIIPLALIILKDHIREDAIDTFEWFKTNDVTIKIISGDNAEAVSAIALKAGVLNSSKYISLEGMDLQKVKEIANEYTIFGRVNPEQKEAIIQALKDNKKTVAMAGDGINDILALKRADCSISIANAADAAKNVSHVVLTDNDFLKLPHIVDEGRRIVNNLQRSASLFLTKTVFAIFFALLFLIISLINIDSPDMFSSYPFKPQNFYIWEICFIGLSSLALTFEKNNDKIKDMFLKNVFKTVIPSASMIIVSTFVIFVLCYISNVFRVPTSVDTMNQAVSMCVLCFSILSMIVLFKVCSPFTKFRKIVFASAASVGMLALLIDGLINMNNKGDSFFSIYFSNLTLMNYVIVLAICIIAATLYFGITHIMAILKGETNNVKDKPRSK